MATWIGADKHRPEPQTLVKQPALDREGEKLSLEDNRFHLYTIEWDEKEVRFLVDDILQHTIEDTVPDRPARVIFGLRQMPWAGDADWEDPQTMLVDWITIEPL